MTRNTGPRPVDPEFFQSLADAEMPKGPLGASVVLHAMLLLFLIILPLVAPQVVTLNYRTVTVAPPPDSPPRTEVVPLTLPPRTRPVEPPPQQSQLPAARVPEPQVPVLNVPAPEAARLPDPVPKPDASIAVSIPPPAADPRPAPNLPPPQQPVVTNVFSSVAAAPNAPARNLEAAGFGDIGGTEGSRTGKSENVARVGGFDGGAAGTARDGKGNRAVVMDSGFTAVPRIAAADAQKKPVAQGNLEKPVDITSKPRPAYTDEARKLRIEGEVLLRVLFMSSGEARVLEVLRGLGHGLDESAVRAAEQIRFKPAQRESQPIDSTAVVHIVFQLAY